MNKNSAKLIFLITFIFLLSGWLSPGIEAAGTSEVIIKQAKDRNKKISALELPVPQSDRDKAYLGLEGSGPFKLNQIKTRILIIEIFNSYCPHCQDDAPRVNNLYRAIQERADLKDKIKIIGIGVGDSPDEVRLFKEEYQVTFPLIPDENSDMVNIFGLKGTPTFIAIRLNSQGLPEKFFFREGGFKNTPQFLNEIIKRSRLK
jgi:thiol-disulfide isomerase/thioredoxin